MQSYSVLTVTVGHFSQLTKRFPLYHSILSPHPFQGLLCRNPCTMSTAHSSLFSISSIARRSSHHHGKCDLCTYFQVTICVTVAKALLGHLKLEIRAMSTKYKRLYHRDFPLHLPENVVVEILLRLPVKSLVRFRCVSKRWRFLISDPRFAKSQFMRASERSQRLLISSSSEIRSLDCEEPFEDSSTPSVLAVPFQKRGRYVSIIGSCNGLVCVALYSHRDFYIWNPSTGTYRKLPDPGITLRARKYRHGFGYDPSTDDYKLLVANFRMHPFRESEAKVFSFKRNSWRRILRGLDDTGLADDSAGILCNGSLHWHLHACREPLTGQKIGGFDLAEEKFHEMPMPSSDCRPHGYVSIDTLSNLGDRLCFIVSMDTHMEIWGMMEYEVIESWAPMHRVGYFRTELVGKDLNPLCLSRGGQLVAMKYGIDLMRSNPDGEILEYAEDFSDCDSRVCYATVFVESLLSPYLCLT